ncbi:hypothetical protein ACNTMW_20135 [Planosporangium sp. 12N6]|uniref:hypothetical protein n=1 Tax=Planosporangium spinosum TaxID=3402278 RepID=UPI003CF723D2
MRTHNLDSWLHNLFEQSASEEFNQVANAEQQALVWLEHLAHDIQSARDTHYQSATNEPPPDTRQRFQNERQSDNPRPKHQKRARIFTPTAEALAIIARLVVHLTRVNATSMRIITLTKVDLASGLIVLMLAASLTGWTLTNDLQHLHIAVVLPSGMLTVWFLGRCALVATSRLYNRRALRLNKLYLYRGARYAVDDLVDRELPRLLRWQRLSERFGQTVLADRIITEITSLDALRRDVSTLSADDLDWALRAELEHPESVPKARYGRDLVVGTLTPFIRPLYRKYNDLKTRIRASVVSLDTARVLASSDTTLALQAWREIEDELGRFYSELGPPPGYQDRENV